MPCPSPLLRRACRQALDFESGTCQLRVNAARDGRVTARAGESGSVVVLVPAGRRRETSRMTAGPSRGAGGRSRKAGEARKLAEARRAALVRRYG